MTEYFPKSEQIDTLNGKLDALNETLKKREDFVSAVAKMEAATASAQTATTTANTAATNANTAAAGVVSPTATVTKSGTTTTVTVTDKSGTTTAEVKDGSDAAVTKDNIVSALGYTPAVAEDKYELLNTITTTETVIGMSVNVDSAGNKLSLAHMYIVFYTDGTWTSDKTGSCYVVFGEKQAYIYPSVLFYSNTSQNTTAIAHAYGSRKEYQHNAYDFKTDGSGSLVRTNSYVKVTPDNTSPITGFWCYVSVGIPAGATMEVYGIRA